MTFQVAISIVSIVLSFSALLVSVRNWRKDFITTRYDNADQALLEIQKIHLQNPEFLDPQWIAEALNSADPKMRYKYDAFATIIWNFLEALYERYGEDLEKSSFYGSMQTLGARHKNWLFLDENFCCYNPGLVNFLRIKKNVEDRPLV